MSQPLSILDRLVIDKAPAQDASTLTASIIRDLLSLLNTWEILDPRIASENKPLLSTVLNYGVENFTGKSIQGDHLERFSGSIEEAIRRFEPRLDPDTLSVKAFQLEAPDKGVVFGLTIEADLAGVENNRRIIFRSEVNSNTGRVTLI